MLLLDTDIMVDLLRGYQPSVDWLGSLDEAPGIIGFVAMELMDGCRNKHEMQELLEQIELFTIYWPTHDDYNRALFTFSSKHLSHNIGVLDTLIGECAIVLNAILCTFNTRHYKAIESLIIEQPYKK